MGSGFQGMIHHTTVFSMSQGKRAYIDYVTGLEQHLGVAHEALRWAVSSRLSETWNIICCARWD